MAALVTYPRFRAWIPGSGAPAASYKVQSFLSGTSTPSALFTDAALTVPAANPFILDANGEATIYAPSTTAYKLQFQDTVGAVIWTVDNITFGGGSGGGSTSSSSEWVQDTTSPLGLTFVNSTSFTLTGDRTGTYHVNRRIKTSNTAGTIYSTVTGVSYSAGPNQTTVTVSSDSGSLDSGLSAIFYGILDSVNVSYPANLGGGSGSKNLLYNGGFDIWQRGAGGSASFTALAARTYTADRWQAQHTGGSCYVTQVAGSVSRYGAKVGRTNGNAVTADVQFAQSLEVNDCARLGALGTPLTISLNLKAGANYSPASSNIRVRVLAGKDAGDTNVLAGYTTPLSVIDATFAITTTTTRYTLSGTVAGASGYTEFGVIISFTPVGTAGADDTFTVENVQLEPNASATSFEVVNFGTVLSRCQRYYEKSFQYTVAPAQNVGGSGNFFNFVAGKAGAATEFGAVPFLVQKRVAPTLVSFNPAAANAQIRDVTASVDCSAVAFSGGSLSQVIVGGTGNASTAVGNQLTVGWTADADIA